VNGWTRSHRSWKRSASSRGVLMERPEVSTT
jgi:hypothetical protein